MPNPFGDAPVFNLAREIADTTVKLHVLESDPTRLLTEAKSALMESMPHVGHRPLLERETNGVATYYVAPTYWETPEDFLNSVGGIQTLFGPNGVWRDGNAAAGVKTAEKRLLGRERTTFRH